MKNKELFYMNLIYYISMVLVAIVFVLGYLNVFNSDFVVTLLLQLVVISAIPILLYSLLVSKNFKQTFKDFGFKKLSGKLVGLSILIAITLYFLNIFVADCFQSIVILLGYETSIPVLAISNKEILQEFVLTACLPGLCEEILHRGMMLNACKKHGYTRYGLIFSSILFGLMHLNIMQFFYATILGFCMGLAVLATESIWTGVICHFTNNFLSVYFSFNKGWPFQNLYNYFIDLIYDMNYVTFIIMASLLILALVSLFAYLLRLIAKVKATEKAKALANELNLNEMTDEEAKAKVEEINILLQNIKPMDFKTIYNKNKSNFVDNIFLISSICLGVLATIFSFITGIL